MASTPLHCRIARPVRDLRRAVRMYREGLGLAVIGGFEDHAGFDGTMLGEPASGFHLEFTHCRAEPVAPAPTHEDLLVFYVPDAIEWQRRCAAMRSAGFHVVGSFNPYWDAHGMTFEDAEGYRVVLQNASPPPPPAADSGAELTEVRP